MLYRINRVFPLQFLNFFHALLLFGKLSKSPEVLSADFFPLNAKIDFLLNCSLISGHKEVKNAHSR